MRGKHLCTLWVNPICNAKTFLQIACAQHASGHFLGGKSGRIAGTK